MMAQPQLEHITIPHPTAVGSSLALGDELGSAIEHTLYDPLYISALGRTPTDIGLE